MKNRQQEPTNPEQVAIDSQWYVPKLSVHRVYRIPQRLLRLPEVIAKTGRSRTAIYDAMAAGSFPSAVPLGPGSHSVGWVEEELENYIANQIAASRTDGVRYKRRRRCAGE